jgi:thiosulfate/3-mercaptopyruvate sulfurtransferase
MMDNLVSVAWLNENIGDKDLVLLDVRSENNMGKEGFHTIPGAQHFDLKRDFSNGESPFPNTVPNPNQFEAGCQKLGINRSSKIVVFDDKGIYSSPRAWWLFKIMGHDEVSVLDGGLPEWQSQGNDTATQFVTDLSPGDFKASFSPQFVKSYEDVVENSAMPAFGVVDARSEGRFDGTAPDPRKHLKSGYIPHSINIPFQSVLDTSKFKSTQELKALFDRKLDGDAPLVFSCGSGLTACIVMLAHELVYQDGGLTLFDGSWTEWAERQGLTYRD